MSIEDIEVAVSTLDLADNFTAGFDSVIPPKETNPWVK